MYELARIYHTSVTQIQQDNHIWDSRRLQIGTRLRIRMAGKNPTSLQQVGVRKVLHATLTAYTAGVESTGKTKSHPAYGITSSGARVKEGRTIAVDPRVIPIGATVYIEGIGIRVAEDTGSAIRGPKIDVYMDDVRKAIRFGVKHNRKVYVLRTTS
jgi:3D (Asp-Asp-Asp) domain-containing protein